MENLEIGKIILTFLQRRPLFAMLLGTAMIIQVLASTLTAFLALWVVLQTVK